MGRRRRRPRHRGAQLIIPRWEIPILPRPTTATLIIPVPLTRCGGWEDARGERPYHDRRTAPPLGLLDEGTNFGEEFRGRGGRGLLFGSTRRQRQVDHRRKGGFLHRDMDAGLPRQPARRGHLVVRGVFGQRHVPRGRMTIGRRASSARYHASHAGVVRRSASSPAASPRRPGRVDCGRNSMFLGR